MTLCPTLPRVRRWILATVAFGLLPSCGSGSAEQQGSGATGGAGTNVGTGGASLSGGSPGAGGQSLGAGAPGSGGAPVGNGGTVVSGGAGGAPGNGGSKASGGVFSGGASGTSAGGVTGGMGGISAGGATGGTGGSATGGATASGGAGGNTTCPFPTSFQWTSTGPLADPMSPSGHNFVSLKDFTIVHFSGQYVVYATVFDKSASWSSVNFNFSDFSQAAAAPQTWMGNLPTGGAVAPTLFYFTPKSIWVLTYQWGFKYSTTTDPTKPSTWTSGKTLLNGDPTGGGGTGPIDQTVICDSMNCYLFFAGDNGHIYRASMPIGNFPGAFSNATSILSDTTANLFEAVEVYTVKGTGKYLMIVEAEGSGGRYFRAFSATSLDGAFSPIAGASTEATPFAGKKNVTFTGTAWTNDISHGDMVREDPSETQTIDPCKMQFLYQGRDPKSTASYGELPYRPGLLTRMN